MQWPQPGGPGSPVFISYSYSNLLDGSLLLLTAADLRAATEEVLGLWASYAPLHFVERPDSGPFPADAPYPPGDHPQIRLGHHEMLVAAHAFPPEAGDGIGGDIHFEVGLPWTLGSGRWNFLEAMTHEMGHVLGLSHELERTAIMNPDALQRFQGLGSAFLFPADVENLQAIYGAGRGSVQPLAPVPEPATVALVAMGAAVIAHVRRRRIDRPLN